MREQGGRRVSDLWGRPVGTRRRRPSPLRAATYATEPDLRRAAPVNLEAMHGATAAAMPEGVGVQGRRTLIKGRTILSMDERVGNHAVGDVLLDGSKIVEVAARIDAPDAAVVDASGHIVMPGFIDAHSSRPCCAAFLPTAFSSTMDDPKAHTIIMSRFCRSFRWFIARRRLHQLAFRRNRTNRD